MWTLSLGDVLYLNVLGQGIIMLGSLKAARDLLEKRSANYSDRLTSVMVQLYVSNLDNALASSS